MIPRRWWWLALAVGLAGCARPAPDRTGEFFAYVSTLCGTTYEGFSSFPTDPHEAVEEKLVVHVKRCSASQIRMPFYIGDDRSRTWILSKVDGGLQLKHDHRQEDGTPDPITDYGGLAQPGGTEREQSFAADAHTKEILPTAATNVWTLRFSEDGSRLDYELDRHGEPRFRATLTKVGS